MKIYCGGCQADIDAVLKTGADLFPTKPHLAELPFWECPCCGNYVGCHYKTERPTRPLGSIPTVEQRRMRRVIHQEIGRASLPAALAYRRMAQALKVRSYHTAALVGDEQHRAALKAAMSL